MENTFIPYLTIKKIRQHPLNSSDKYKGWLLRFGSSGEEQVDAVLFNDDRNEHSGVSISLNLESLPGCGNWYAEPALHLIVCDMMHDEI